MKGFEAAAHLLPGELEEALRRVPPGDRRECEELRLRLGRRPTVLLRGLERPFSSRPVRESDLRALVERATKSSLHARTEQLARGFVTAAGGVRVGLCGEAVMGFHGPEGFRRFTSAAVRVPREVFGCADGLWDGLTEKGFRSTLILAPPGAGKTTLLRELCRRLSVSGYRVAVADERWEIAGEMGGGFDLGPCTDVMSGVPKAAGASLLLRAMNPQIIAMDEITDPADGKALLEAAGCGVSLLATVHAGSREELCRRNPGRELLESGLFARCVTVNRTGAERHCTLENIP